MSDLREIDSISDLRSLTGGVNQTSVHVRTPSEEAGVFLPKNKDPFGLGDDGAIALQADQSTWWARESVLRGERINAGDFGLAGDGQTDDEPELQKAIDAAENEGLTLILPPGDYYLRDRLVVDESLTIAGHGPDTALCTDKDERLLEIVDASDVSIRGVRFVGNADPDNDLQRAITVDDGENIFVDCCIFENLAVGVISNGVDTMMVTRSHFEHMVGSTGGEPGWGVIFSPSAQTGAFSKNDVWGCQFDDVNRHAIYFSAKVKNGSAYGNFILNADQTEIEINCDKKSHKNRAIKVSKNCIEYDNGIPTREWGIEVHTTPEGQTNGKHTLSGNKIKGLGVKCSGDRNVVKDNRIKCSTGHGILVNDSPRETKIVDNVVIKAGEVGIRTINAGDCALRGNTVRESSKRGIYATNSGGENGIISENHVSKSGDSGIVLQDRSGMVVAYNHAHRNNKHGILLRNASSNSLVEGNYCRANNQGDAPFDYSGIGLRNCGDHMVTANMCRKEGDPPKDDPPYPAYGIDIGPDCSNIAVTNNDFRNAGKSGSMYDNGVGTITTPSNIV